MDVKLFVEKYIRGELKNFATCGNWNVINWGGMDVLQYQTDLTKNTRQWSGDKYVRSTEKVQDKPERIAYRLADGSILFNSNQLVYAVKYSYGHKLNDRGTGQTDQQIQLEAAGCIPIPFMIFDQIPGADIRDFSFVVKPKPETIIEKVLDGYGRYDTDKKETVYDYRDRSRHFSGACVFKILEDYFLFDIDRKEIRENKIFNPFISKLPVPVETIEQAYQALMPDEVRKAISEGIPVKRQGEYFFIFYSEENPVKVELTDEEKQILRFPPSRNGYGIRDTTHTDGRFIWLDEDTKPFGDTDPLDTPEKQEFQKYALRYKVVREKERGMRTVPGTLSKNGSSGSHSVEKYVSLDGIVYVSGLIKQSRREHGDLILTGWYRVYANTGVQNWTITGKID